ncbi:hypothetical protein C791_4165 [Amycolatopsis azurea DSM 43854]|uniref:Uncharacterized protein n=1 Tax=Amycolatopsis azurea DSM 43854 TaxID=1238180 RepID=M2Q1W7_9PSEU|nr:hypothetical protein C791_4165 [Amycolatopsis azurea DSM 43854]
MNEADSANRACLVCPGTFAMLAAPRATCLSSKVIMSIDHSKRPASKCSGNGEVIA